MIEFDYTPGVLKYSKDFDESQRQEYVNRVYQFLMKLAPGKKISIDTWTKPETRDLFIEVVKMYIDEHGGQDVVFTGNYEGIKKIS